MFAGLGVGDNMAITSLRALLFTAGGVVAVGGVAYLSGAFEKPATPPATQAEAPAQSTPETAAPEAPAPDTKEAKTASGTQERVPAASAGDGQAEPQNTQAENTPPQAAAQTPATAVVAPTFDVVRIEGNGSAVIAGKAVAGAKVEIVHGSIVLGETTAGADGTFAIVLNRKLRSTSDTTLVTWQTIGTLLDQSLFFLAAGAALLATAWGARQLFARLNGPAGEAS